MSHLPGKEQTGGYVLPRQGLSSPSAPPPRLPAVVGSTRIILVSDIIISAFLTLEDEDDTVNATLVGDKRVKIIDVEGP